LITLTPFPGAQRYVTKEKSAFANRFGEGGILSDPMVNHGCTSPIPENARRPAVGAVTISPMNSIRAFL
jgi:hypothetical protein